MTPAELTAMLPHASSRASIYAEPLMLTMAEFAIDTPRRQAAFLANIAHESGSLLFIEEIASGVASRYLVDRSYNANAAEHSYWTARGCLLPHYNRGGFWTCERHRFDVQEGCC